MNATATQPAKSAARVIFPAKQRVELEPYAVAEPGKGQVRVRTQWSLMSTGTENICFNALFEPGTHWSRWIEYPMAPGYACIGVVDAIGEGVTSLALGQPVAARASHASHHVVKADDAYPVPAGIDPRLATWFALGKISFMGARAAAYQIGDDVTIIGAGPIGQISVRWARALGCRRIVVVDPLESRLALARAGGATATVARPLEEAGEAIVAANGGEQPRLIIDGTGNQQVFSQALKLLARFGRIVVLGDTGTPSGQRLTYDVVVRGLTIVGAWDGHEDARRNQASIVAYFFQLLADGRLPLAGMNTHVFAPRDCAKAYELANTRRGETIGILFDWTGSTP